MATIIKRKKKSRVSKKMEPSLHRQHRLSKNSYMISSLYMVRKTGVLARMMVI